MNSSTMVPCFGPNYNETASKLVTVVIRASDWLVHIAPVVEVSGGGSIQIFYLSKSNNPTMRKYPITSKRIHYAKLIGNIFRDLGAQ